MTFLDKLAVGAIITNSLLITWDAIVGSFVITRDNTFLAYIDTYALIATAGLFGLFVLVFFLWFLKLIAQVKYFEWSQNRKYLAEKKEKAKYIDNFVT